MKTLKIVLLLSSITCKQIIDEKTRHPTIKIIGIGEELNYKNNEELEENIRNNNFKNIEGLFKINYIYTNPKNKMKTIFASCGADIFHKVKSSGRILV